VYLEGMNKRQDLLQI